MTHLQHQQQGFTLIELLVVIAILGILVTIAVPSYQSYTRRAHYTEVVQAAAPYKLGVEACYQATVNLSSCQPGKYGVPTNKKYTSTTSLIDTIEVQDGKITITPKEKFGITPKDDYILSPIADGDRLEWATSGGSVVAGYAN